MRASCRTPEEVIEAGAGVDAFLVQYAPITADVFEALPQLRLVSRYGVGVDAVDTDAAARHGVWVCNVPDYGTVEVRCTPSRCCWHSAQRRRSRP